jgi:salicylate hydroxylase
MRIAVIGTGVAGSLLVEALNGQGLAVMAFDQAAPGAQETAGTALNLGPNALKTLRTHLPARHVAVRAASLPWRRWFIDLTDGTRLFDLDLLDVAEEPGVRIRWAELYRTTRAAISPHYSHVLEALEQDAAGRLVPVFRDPAGALRRHGGFDLLVAADGRYSRLRSLAAGTPEPQYYNVCLSRLLVPAGQDCPIDDYGQWFAGPNRMLAFRVPGDLVYVTGAFPLDEQGRIPAEIKRGAALDGIFCPADRPACAAVTWMLAEMRNSVAQTHWARLQQIAPLHRALEDRVLLVGDAAHAMVPTLGQGATQAVEDAAAAALVIGRRPGTRHGLLDEYEAMRSARLDWVRALSLQASDTLLGQIDPVEGARAKHGAAFRAQLRRLYTETPHTDPRGD